jgi:hypothetical protein
MAPELMLYVAFMSNRLPDCCTVATLSSIVRLLTKRGTFDVGNPVPLFTEAAVAFHSTNWTAITLLL